MSILTRLARIGRRVSPISAVVSFVSYLTMVIALFRLVTDNFSIDRSRIFEAAVRSYREVFHGFIDTITFGLELSSLAKDLIVVYVTGFLILLRAVRSYEDPKIPLHKYVAREGWGWPLAALAWPLLIVAAFILPILLRKGGQLFALSLVLVIAILYETAIVAVSLLVAIAFNAIGIL